MKLHRKEEREGGREGRKREGISLMGGKMVLGRKREGKSNG
jgi:hypothetical protein